MTLKQPLTPLAQANAALREKNYPAAISLYVRALQGHTFLASSIRLNLEIARNRHRKLRASAARPSVALCGVDLSPQGSGRVLTLIQSYQAFGDVEIIGGIFPAWGGKIDQQTTATQLRKHLLVIEDESCFVDRAVEFVAAHPYDIVHLGRLQAPNVFFGLLYKLLWAALVLVDLDDDAMAPNGLDASLSLDDYLGRHGALPALKHLTDNDWTRLAIGMVDAFDGTTASTTALKQRYGGILLPDPDGPPFQDQLARCVPGEAWDRVLKHLNRLLPQGLAQPATPSSASFVSLPATKQGPLEVNASAAKCLAQDPSNFQAGDLERPGDLDPYYFDLIVRSGLYDSAWYLRQYRQKYGITINPLTHYLTVGVKERLNPSPGFDTHYYLESNPDVAAAGVHPFIHFVSQGKREGRKPLPPPPLKYTSRYAASAPEYVSRLPPDIEPIQKPVKVVCFYLPQFHPIPENDAWWGRGFTEWTNVRPAMPQFVGHYQPHVPDEYLGYYNLLDRGVQAKQVELARQYGIEGFCFYIYWFSGVRLLEQPLDNYLKDPSLDLPFCVCWANENWSRRWDGLDQDLLMVQNYSDSDDINFIRNVAKYLRDPRHIRIGGRPLLLVYRPNLFPSMKATSQRWREWCRANHIGEIYLGYPQSFERVDPAAYGFDAAIDFPPNNSAPPNITRYVTPCVDEFSSSVYDWRIFVERSETYQNPGYKLFRGACPSWDNTARRKNKGTVFHNNCPKLFTKWLTNAFEDTLNRFDNPDEQIVFVNAWNEWAEGAHLEPDQRYGYAWLQAVRDAHQAVLKRRTRIVVVTHDAHPHGAQILCLNFARYFKEQFHFDVEMIVLGEGRLLPKYAVYATVHRLDLAAANEPAIDEVLSALRRKGAAVAIVNTTVSGKLTPHLKEHGFKVVALVHEMPGILSSYSLQEHAAQIAAHADKVVFPARQVQEGFETFIGQPLRQAVIRPQGIYLRSSLRDGASKHDVGVAVRQKLGLPERARIIMCAGYADHRKGFDLFVRACLIVARHVPDTYALWVGHVDQPFVDESLKPAAAQGMLPRFVFTGLVEQPQEYYLAADIYALTSREDPFPSVVMESLDALTPVVAFKGCGGFEELLERDCGILVPAEDCSAFARALVELLENPELARSLAATGQTIVETELSFRHYLFDLLALAGHSLPRVSVVVPNYNYEKYIRQRLETIVNQTYPVYELIVLDDLSQDDSVSIINDFLRGAVVPRRVEINEQNSGSVFLQWSKGVQMARGDLVWIAEADDLADPRFLECLVPFFADCDVVLGYAQSKQIDEYGKVMADDYTDYTADIGDYWKRDYVCDGQEDVRRALCIKNTIPNVSGALLRRDVLAPILEQHVGELTSYKVAGDWALYIYMAEVGKIAFCARALNHHRRHGHSVTKVNNHLDEVVRVHAMAGARFALSAEARQSMTRYEEYLARYFAAAV